MAKNSAANKSNVTARSKRTKKYVPKYLHVAYRYPEGWIIYNQNYRTLSTHDTRDKAVEVARPIAKKNEFTLVIHRRDNRVMKWECYYRGPIPPPQFPKVRYPTDPPRTATVEAIQRAVTEAVEARRNNEAKRSESSDRAIRGDKSQRQSKASLKSASQR
jgi:hypothetical protein